MKLETSQHALRTVIRDALEPLMAGHEECTLLDFPNHSNVGDSAIWSGEIAFLRQIGRRIRYICTTEDYDREVVGRGDSLILIHGGGNFGDLWPVHQQFRERVLVDFPERRIIQLPQSIHFSRPDLLATARAAIAGHRDFHILVRDGASAALARRHFDAPVHLCPDMAHQLGMPLFSKEDKTHRFVVLARSDKERVGTGNLDLINAGKGECLIADWIDEPSTRQKRYYHLAQRLSRSCISVSSPLNRLTLHTANALADQRLMRGWRLLAQGEAILTDRLHACLLGRLGGSRVYYVDNTYGKLSSYVQFWLGDDEELIRCGTFAEAFERARVETPSP